MYGVYSINHQNRKYTIMKKAGMSGPINTVHFFYSSIDIAPD